MVRLIPNFRRNRLPCTRMRTLDDSIQGIPLLTRFDGARSFRNLTLQDVDSFSDRIDRKDSLMIDAMDAI